LSIERHFTLKLHILKFENTQKLRKKFFKNTQFLRVSLADF